MGIWKKAFFKAGSAKANMRRMRICGHPDEAVRKSCTTYCQSSADMKDMWKEFVTMDVGGFDKEIVEFENLDQAKSYTAAKGYDTFVWVPLWNKAFIKDGSAKENVQRMAKCGHPDEAICKSCTLYCQSSLGIWKDFITMDVLGFDKGIEVFENLEQAKEHAIASGYETFVWVPIWKKAFFKDGSAKQNMQRMKTCVHPEVADSCTVYFLF